LASGSDDKTIKIWDSSSGLVKKTLFDHSSSVLSLTVMKTGELASGSQDGTIKIRLC
jgi:WD40 repeat protein